MEKTTFSKKYTYVVEPKRQGNLKIGPATITVDGNMIQTKSITIIVNQAVEIPKDPNDPSFLAKEKHSLGCSNIRY